MLKCHIFTLLNVKELGRTYHPCEELVPFFLDVKNWYITSHM